MFVTVKKELKFHGKLKAVVILRNRVRNDCIVHIKLYNSRKIRLLEVNAKCRNLKNWHVKGLCGRCLLKGDSQFLAYIQSSWYLKPSFKIYTLPAAPLPFSLVQLSPLPCVKSILYIMCEGGGWGSVRYRILQEFYTLFLIRFITYKIARPPLTKTKEGKVPSER
jgi:hypothetical protein